MEQNELWITGAGGAIRRLRGDRPIGDVAESMGIDKSTLSLIERNKRRLSVEEMVTFAKTLNLAPVVVMRECLTEAMPGFRANPGGVLVGRILDALAEQGGD